MKEYIKNIVESLPYPVGRLLSGIPMSLRLGSEYSRYKKSASELNVESAQGVRYFSSIRDLVNYAFNETALYRDLYTSSNILLSDLVDYKYFFQLPIITKSNMQAYSLADRSVAKAAIKKSNTGGTTGQPLDFYLEKSAYAREWAHMHIIWESLGYRYRDEKITIRGKNIGDRYCKYNFNQNEFLINAYVPLEQHLDACRDLISKRNIRWIHGYPSSVFSFMRELEQVDSALFELLLSKVKGVFLGSEYPAPQYRHYLEHHCRLKTISWYGHSEMAILAPEREPGSGMYYPFYSYGFPEAVPTGDSYRLIATSIHNRATPFIRYDTGDLIEPTFRNGMLECFRIKEGRNSDSVIDKNGRHISLTGLIFGRHHAAFDHSEHIQVMQIEPGKIEILITSRASRNDWAELFDFSNAYFDIVYTQLSAPVTSALGKVQLLLR